MTVRVDGLKEIRDYLSVLKKEEIPKAFEITINKTMGQIKTNLQNEIRAKLDRPKPWSVDTLFIDPVKSAQDKYSASIQVKKRSTKGTTAVHVLGHNIIGGSRERKSQENWMIKHGYMKSSHFIVPGPHAKRDKYGNQTNADITNTIAGLSTSIGKGGWKFFISNDGKTVFKAKGAQVQIIWYIVDSVNYSERYKFFDVGVDSANQLLVENADYAIQKAIERRV